MTSLGCNLIIEIVGIQTDDVAALSELCEIDSALRDIRFRHASAVEAIRIVRGAEPAALVMPPPPASAASGIRPPAAVPPAPKPRLFKVEVPAPKPRRRAPRPVSVAAPPPLTCAACGDTFERTERRGKVPKYCKNVECRRKRWAAAQRAKPSDKPARLAYIKRRHARLLAKKRDAPPPEPPDDDPDTARDEAEAARRLGATE